MTRDWSDEIQTAVLDPTSHRPICMKIEDHFLVVWLKGTRTKYRLPHVTVFQRAAKAAAGYEDPPADRRRRKLRARDDKRR
jgi:hypothetical protein